MTGTLEKFVRPFQLDDISPPKPVSSGTSAQSDTNILQYGKSGSVKVLFGSVTIDETFYAIKKMRERPRTA